MQKVSPYVVPGLIKPMTIGLKQFGFKPYLENKLHHLTVYDFADIVFAYTRVALQQIREKNRHRPVSEARHILCYLLRKHYPNATTTGVGKLIGNHADHSTIIHSCKVVKNLMDTDTDFKHLVAQMEGDLLYINARKNIAA